MTTKTQTSQLGKSLESSLIAGSESFNFELWATQVKQQMITSLQVKWLSYKNYFQQNG